MANSNFVVQNGLTVGTTTIFAGNGDITTTGNITVSGGGSFGGLSTNQVYQGASNVTVSGSFVNVSIGSTNVASFSSTGLTVLGTTTTVQNETVQGSLTPSSNIAYNLGSSSQYWSNGWIGQVTANTVTATTIGGTLSTAAQPNITSHGTLTGLTVSGATQTAAITSSGTIIAATVNAATIGNSGATLTGTLQTAAQPNITTLAGVTSIGASGSTTLTGTLQTAAQPNITSVGTLTGLTVSGNTAHTNTVYAQGIYDNSNRVVSTVNTTAGTGISLSVQTTTGPTTAVTITNSGVTGLSSSGTGNLTVSASTGSVTLALPSTGPGAASVGSSTAIPVITTDVYGRVSATSTAAVVAPAGTLTGSTLASGVTASSLTSVGTLTGLTVTATITGSVSGSAGSATGNAGTATTLQTARAINGVSFNGSADITVPAAAGTLSGATLASGVTASSLTSVGTLTGLTVSGAIVPNGNLTVNLGSTSAWWNNIYGTAIHSLYADLAENYQADKTYMPGTVVMFGGDAEVTIATADTTAVAGVVSTNPAHLMNGGLSGPNVAPVALMGRVPCMVIGPVAKGDLLVSAGFGYAKVNNTPPAGTIIGKALQDVPFNGKAVIEVVVGRT